MNCALPVAIASLLLVGLVGPSQCREFSLDDDYLRLPKPSQFDQAEHRNVREAMLKLGLTATTSPDEIVKKFNQAYSSEPNKDHADIYRVMSTLNNQLNYCPMTDIVKSILAQARADPQSPLNYFRELFEVYVGPRMKRCAVSSQGEFTKPMPPLAVFDQVFSKALGVRDVNNLAAALSKFDISEDRMNVAKMVKAIALIKNKPVDTKHIELVAVFLDDRCDQMRRHQKLIEPIIMAKKLVNYETPLQQQRRMVEYQRLCQAWTNMETRAKIWDNIVESSQHSSICAKLGTCLH